MKFVERHIPSEIALMYPTKGAQEVAQPRPQAFFSVGMRLKPAIAIVIARPLFILLW